MSLPAGLPRGSRVVRLSALDEQPPRPPGALGWLAETTATRSWPAALLRAATIALPRADGEPVMVFPGFGSTDVSTIALRSTLQRCGFRVEGWKLGLNRGNVEAMLPRVRQRVEEFVARTGSPARLVGWSLGGVLARETARDAPELVDRVVTLGSPVIGGPKFTNVAAFYRALGVDVDAIARQVEERNQQPIEVPVVAIYSRTDGIVDWRASVDRTSLDVEHLEVQTSHLLLGVDPTVQALVAHKLL